MHKMIAFGTLLTAISLTLTAQARDGREMGDRISVPVEGGASSDARDDRPHRYARSEPKRHQHAREDRRTSHEIATHDEVHDARRPRELR
jgi:hypothetical protein